MSFRLDNPPIVICPCPWERGRCEGETPAAGAPKGMATGLVHLKAVAQPDGTLKPVEMISCAVFLGHGGPHTFGLLTPDQHDRVGRRVVLRPEAGSNELEGVCPECSRVYRAQVWREEHSPA